MLRLDDLPSWFYYAFGVPFGLVWGSFLNVVIHRLPREQNVAFPGSACPSCGAAIRARDNIPVLSYLVLRGRARCCGASISPRYPAVEIASGLLALALLRLLVLQLPGDTNLLVALATFALHFALGLGLLALALIDLEHMLLPDSLTLGGLVLGLATAGFRGVGFAESALGAALGFAIVFVPFDLVYSRLRGHPGMGLGDAKLTALAGAWFGWEGALFALFGGAVQATLVVLAVVAVRGKLDEPEAVVQERALVEAALHEAEGEERAELERALAEDPVLRAPEPGLAQARLPFGPFLALAILEYLLLQVLGLTPLLGLVEG